MLRSDRTIRKTPGRCIFCDGLGMSKQHVWPKWLSSNIAKPHLASNEERKSVTRLRHGKLTSTSGLRKLDGSTMSRKVRVVCRQCNNGWMSRIEEISKPTILRLVNGGDQILNRSEMLAVASWITLFCLCLEWLDSSMLVSENIERKNFAATKTPPENWKIWIAPYAGGQWEGSFRRTAMYLLPRQTSPSDIPPAMSPNTQTVTFSVGGMAAHVVSTKLCPSPLNAISFPGLLQIWPPTNQKATGALHDPDLDLLSQALVQHWEPRIDSSAAG